MNENLRTLAKLVLDRCFAEEQIYIENQTTCHIFANKQFYINGYNYTLKQWHLIYNNIQIRKHRKLYSAAGLEFSIDPTDLYYKL